MAGAVPGLIRRIPADDAAQMRTDRGAKGQSAILVAIGRHFFPSRSANHQPLVIGNERASERRSAVLSPGSRGSPCSPSNSPRWPTVSCAPGQRGPATDSEDAFVEHHGRQRAEGHARAGKAGGDELILGDANVGQPIGRFDHLSRPAMGQLDARHERGEGFLESPIVGAGVAGLARLVVLAAEDHQVVVALGVDTEIAVGICPVSHQSASVTTPLGTRPATTYEE